MYETVPIVRRLERNAIINLHRDSCIVTVILVRFLWKLNFLDMLAQCIKILNFVEICLVGVDLFHADERRTDEQKYRQS